MQEQAPSLNEALIQRILTAYGEEDLANNAEVIKGMLDQMKGHEVLNMDAFAQALTLDVELYSVSHEMNYESVYHTLFRDLHKKPKQLNMDDSQKTETETVHEKQEPSPNHGSDTPEPLETDRVTHSFTAPAIDSTAGTYRSKSTSTNYIMQ